MLQPCDIAAERAILSGIWSHGSEIYYDIADMVQPSSFTTEDNINLFTIIREIYTLDDTTKLDIPTIQSKGKILNLEVSVEYLRAIMGLAVSETNVRRFATKIRKLEIGRLLRGQINEAGDKLLTISGEEPVLQILNIAEDAIFNFTSLLNDGSNEPSALGDGLMEYLTHLAEHPVTQMGIPTGFHEFDRAIGGGLRNATVNVIGARSKIGKTFIADTIGSYITETIKYPVLNMDTEMLKEDHIHRTMAGMTGIDVLDIECGKVNVQNSHVLKKTAEDLETSLYFIKNIASMPFEDQLAVMRRWLMKVVGLNKDGTAKPCVIIYDYIKLMDSVGISADLKEYQLLGFMMTSLHNFAVRYKIPILAFTQLNRDGINKETTAAASGSDRILWLCSNFSIFKEKSVEEVAEDGVENGNRKMVVLASRHGMGLNQGDYINLKLEKAKVTELGLRSQVKHQVAVNEGFQIADEDQNLSESPYGEE
jgi:replicative DNA helicase